MNYYARKGLVAEDSDEAYDMLVSQIAKAANKGKTTAAIKLSDSSVFRNFKNYLEKNGINVTIRREMGRDINGACGQLRKSYLDHEKEG